MKAKNKTDIEPAFRCPKCGGFEFGRDTKAGAAGAVEVLETVRCHSPGCDWHGQWPPVVPVQTNEAQQHTPGPWHTPGEVFEPMKHGHREGNYRAIGVGNGAFHIGYASVSGCVEEDEALANARLIAAAPVLLAACKAALQEVEADSVCWSESQWKASNKPALWAALKAAIARATGQEGRK